MPPIASSSHESLNLRGWLDPAAHNRVRFTADVCHRQVPYNLHVSFAVGRAMINPTSNGDLSDIVLVLTWGANVHLFR